MFNKPDQPEPIDDKPKHRVINESTAISRFFSAVGRAPRNREELVKWVKESYGANARVA